MPAEHVYGNDPRDSLRDPRGMMDVGQGGWHPFPLARGADQVTSPMTWGLPWEPTALPRGDGAVGGPGARLGHCLGLAYFRAGSGGAAEPAALLLARAERVFLDVMLAWCGNTIPISLP